MNAEEEDDGLLVRCAAYNDLGKSETSNALTIIRCPVKGSTSCFDISHGEPSYLWIGIGGLAMTSFAELLIICFLCNELININTFFPVQRRRDGLLLRRHFYLIYSRKMAAMALVVLCSLTFSEAALFQDEPVNRTAEVGGRLTFRCAFNQEHDCAFSHWVYSRSQCTEGHFKVIGTCRSLSDHFEDTSRLALSFDPRVSQLQINDVQPGDTGYYTCWDSLEDEYSRCGYLKVVDPPTPLCTLLSSGVEVAESVTLKCQVPENALARTKLTWHPQTSHSIRSLKVNSGESYTVQRVVQESDIFKGFTCIAGNDINNGPNCTVYPFGVDMVTVPPFKQDIPRILSATTLQLECMTDAVPLPTHYSWSVKEAAFPNGTLPEWTEVTTHDRYQMTDDHKTFLVVNPAKRDDGLQVRCTASSYLRESETSEAVTIVRCPDGHLVADSSNSGCEIPPEPPYVWTAGVGVLAITAVVEFVIICVLCTRKRAPEVNQDGRRTLEQRNGDPPPWNIYETSDQQNFPNQEGIALSQYMEMRAVP
ncbi:uncharacterized protein LOC110979026 [Acanthaster planci]|uniref:Uncharacterized protein LOC110979026 n=1 Tax=Acanthaster planci TaxID=133434 RepID=A0A8B7YC70_ACAPL|nr:uncharacterized protein LOC110979026 [Acanthaster planci]